VERVFDERLDAWLAGRVVGHRLARSRADPLEIELVMKFASRAAPRRTAKPSPAQASRSTRRWDRRQVEAVSYY
jgi:hypothetical protein